MKARKEFEDALKRWSDELIRIGSVSPSRMAMAEANLRRLGELYAQAQTEEDVRRLKAQMDDVFMRWTKANSRKEMPTIPTWRVSRLKPVLREELDRRIAASASLIKLNRGKMITECIQRFSGWATSESDVAKLITPPRAVLTLNKQDNDFLIRRVRIDQTQKLRANIAEIAAHEMGAIAFEWEGQDDHRERMSHRKRNGKTFLIRDSWAHKQGLIKPAADVAWNDFDDGPPGIPVFCRCHARYIFDLDDLPDACLTDKGRDYIARATG